MKAALIGVGQAGGKVTEALLAEDRRAGYGAIRGTLAVNTAKTDLEPLDIKTMLVGQERVKGQGVGADNELGAEVMQSDIREVMGELDGVVDPQTEAIFVVAGLGGGTGSGGAPVLVKELKRVHEIPVYALGILPGREEGGIYQANAGRSLKTLVREADSTLLVDNDAWRKSGESVTEAFDAINERIARRIGILLAAGENIEGVGESVVDSSEVINTLKSGDMSAIGFANADAAPDPGENINVITSTTRKSLLTGMSVPETTEAGAALVVVAGDSDRIPRKGVEKARSWVETETRSMQVRGGDFPLDSEKIAVLVLLSGIARSERLEAFMERAQKASEAVETEQVTENFQNEELDDLL
ncbi:tubulin/FtsZ family protein [Halobacterium bonnevillei]|jgi:cell division GTPase FtsZ|uniref:Tubulin-like protein CetZ n=1 Tax=Halobacterium bonnevillei TaxID=2692200 RepID=A0A6B0SML8_9EURY|nr:tubulin/FtsZ family protein [Halobacterium bonnevillei]MXR20763.1 cell division protein [Halobacterium bonnevillei]